MTTIGLVKTKYVIKMNRENYGMKTKIINIISAVHLLFEIIYLVLGIGIGTIGSAISMRKYLEV